MKVSEIRLSVFEVPAATRNFDLEQTGTAVNRRWMHKPRPPGDAEYHVLHVLTDEGVEGICTVGDVRYTSMTSRMIEQLRILAIGENPLDRERLFSKLRKATRSMFVPHGWFGAFDNCLWDIAGKISRLPVHALIGRARDMAPAYYNYRGGTPEEAADDALRAVGQGFTAVKDHFRGTGRENVPWFEVARRAVGPGVDLLHDAAGCDYTLDEAVHVGRALEEMAFRWFEEPLPDRRQGQLQHLCERLEIPVLCPETLMNDLDLSAQWIISGATDLLRANARHGTTAILRLAHLAEMHGTGVELNGPGGLFGLLHAHLACSISNTSYYEYFPGGSRDELGKELGLLNPPLPEKGYIAPPDGPGWGAEWDRDYFEKRRSAVL